MIHLYGISNCDTVKKARHWLDQRGLAYQFHDFKKEGLDDALLRAWVAQLGWETLLNRRGTSWRKVPETIREQIDEAGAIRLMLQNPSLIKRPLLEQQGRYLVGFEEHAYAQQLDER